MSLAMRVRVPVVSTRTAAVRPSQVARPVRLARLVRRASPQDVEKKIVEALKEAEDVCADGTKEDCAVAWDTVEELSAAASHLKANTPVTADPLEVFCNEEGNADADECRVYED